MMKLFRNWATLGCIATCYVLTGCGGGNDGFKTADQVKMERPDAGKKDHDHDHGHDHHAPHHGSLTELGDHVAQIELVLDAEAGKLTVYVLDGEAEKGLAVDQTELELAVTLPDAKEPLTLKLAPADAAKPEAGFIVQDDKLKGVATFKGTLASLKVKDKAHDAISVEFDAKKAAAAAYDADDHGHAHDEKKADDHKDHDHKDEHKDEKQADEKKADKPAEGAK